MKKTELGTLLNALETFTNNACSTYDRDANRCIYEASDRLLYQDLKIKQLSQVIDSQKQTADILIYRLKIATEKLIKISDCKNDSKTLQVEILKESAKETLEKIKV